MPVTVEFRENFYEPFGRRILLGPFDSVTFVTTDACGLVAVEADTERVVPVADLMAGGDWKLCEEALLYAPVEWLSDGAVALGDGDSGRGTASERVAAWPTN